MIELAYHRHRMAEAEQLQDAWRARCAALEAALIAIAGPMCGDAQRIARDALKGGKGKRK